MVAEVTIESDLAIRDPNAILPKIDERESKHLQREQLKKELQLVEKVLQAKGYDLGKLNKMLGSSIALSTDDLDVRKYFELSSVVHDQTSVARIPLTSQSDLEEVKKSIHAQVGVGRYNPQAPIEELVNGKPFSLIFNISEDFPVNGFDKREGISIDKAIKPWLQTNLIKLLVANPSNVKVPGELGTIPRPLSKPS